MTNSEFEKIVRESIREELALLKEGMQTVFIWSDDFGKTYGLYDKVKGNPKPIVKGNPKSMGKLLKIVSTLSPSEIEDEFFETKDGESYGEINVAMKKLEGLKTFVREAKERRLTEVKRISTGDAKKFEKALIKNAPDANVTWAKAALHKGEVKLFVNYKSFKQRRALAAAGKKLGLTYDNDGRSTNRPGLDHKRGDRMVGGKGVLGIQNNWMTFVKESTDLEESRASKFLAVLGLTGALLGLGKMNSSDPVMKAIQAKTEQADTPAEKKALKDLATARLVYLDTGKGEGGDITVNDVLKVVNESVKPYGKGDKVRAHITGDVPTTYLIQGPPKKSPMGLAYRAKNLRSGKVVGLLHTDITE